ncbi:class I SAM-dependent methyltransferase [[Bacillus] enclensis]|uniref:class I SAM-dependent methyltransferase n=1 Tax=[Bacillus] enclensis TaxID=1402860 RepID=UPI0018DD890F|nr:class I SAM-dependent methyltransferase [[Bacillus] enclensis]MBH9964932.1 class I SAM-dependent methyltransferase [[Bacillus] enclensis]
MNQQSISKINQIGWNQSPYQAWVNRHGTPAEYARVLKTDPEKTVAHYLNFMGDVNGKKIINLLGSKGNKAVSLVLLGADVTVVDISEGNKQYAAELAEAAGVHIHYVVSDVLTIPDEEQLPAYDFVILEVGVLHYFMDLNPLFELVFTLLKPGGRFILRDYHPMVSKLLSVENKQVHASGDYFDDGLKEVEVAYSFLLPEDERVNLSKNTIRRWTLGEVVSAVIRAGLTLQTLEEEAGIRWAFPQDSPEGIEDRIPGLFTILAGKL